MLGHYLIFIFCCIKHDRTQVHIILHVLLSALIRVTVVNYHEYRAVIKNLIFVQFNKILPLFLGAEPTTVSGVISKVRHNKLLMLVRLC